MDPATPPLFRFRSVVPDLIRGLGQRKQTRQPDFCAQPFARVQPVLDEFKAAKAALDEALERWTGLETLKEEAERRS